MGQNVLIKNSGTYSSFANVASNVSKYLDWIPVAAEGGLIYYDAYLKANALKSINETTLNELENIALGLQNDEVKNQINKIY